MHGWTDIAQFFLKQLPKAAHSMIKNMNTNNSLKLLKIITQTKKQDNNKLNEQQRANRQTAKKWNKLALETTDT